MIFCLNLLDRAVKLLQVSSSVIKFSCCFPDTFRRPFFWWVVDLVSSRGRVWYLLPARSFYTHTHGWSFMWIHVQRDQTPSYHTLEWSTALRRWIRPLGSIGPLPEDTLQLQCRSNVVIRCSQGRKPYIDIRRRHLLFDQFVKGSFTSETGYS
jgi:hypothetical protein